MRISDWSSDVCSSDLGSRPGVAWRGHRVARLVRGRDMLSPKVEIDRSLDTLPPDTRKAVAGRLHGWLASETEQRLKPLARLVALAGDKAQIGRASCRERGWQYV